MYVLGLAHLKERQGLGSSTFRAALVLAISVAVAACGEAPTEPSHFAPFSQSDLRLGTGEAAVSSNTLTVHYTLWLYNASAASNKGVQIETSAGLTPFTFVLGSGEVWHGTDER